MTQNSIGLILINEKFGICKLKATEKLPEWVLSSSIFSLTRTKEELSVICPENIECEKDWNFFKVKGPLEFDQIGILARISNTLSENEISIFVMSTYDTDYILVKQKNCKAAFYALEAAGMTIEK
ncbi:hypothetical protein BHR79_00400 [Methanohalophilus halophilus]|uniref:ACT domain-containing protein n=1 Tax=Methanohalophilus halophilus TaxID=2177 RepID=A0A1L3Q4L1_9EURY|nr:hypothetical protein BHR79_00400 [Methanohalophilus halophilus]RNI11089.1 ACT domain-containing protein [Methanohalophilus halophilus]